MTVGATVVSDTLSLIVFAVCLSTFQSGFSVSGLFEQLIEIAISAKLLILFGLSRTWSASAGESGKQRDVFTSS